MLKRVCLLLLIVGVYASYSVGGSESTTPDELFGQLEDYFPENFPSRFPDESKFFTRKIFAYLFFNIFTKYFAEEKPIQFWSKFNNDNFHRVAIDAAFYEYLSKFVEKKMKPLIFDLRQVSASSPEEIAIHRIGDYLDNLSAADHSATGSQETEVKNCEHGADVVPTSGIPGKDFPNYCDIPTTSFTCANRQVPGIYADMETGCQVFHTCWPHRMDSFLCPIGTTFNQALLACDYWHESDCSFSSLFDQSPFGNGESTISTDEASSSAPELDIPEYDGTCESLISKPLELRMKFMSVKCEVANLKPIMPETTSESSNYDGKNIDLLSDIRSGNFGDVFASIVKADELRNLMSSATKLSELKMDDKISKLHSTVVITESPLKHGTSEEPHSTNELPSDHPNQIPRVQSRFVEKPAFKGASREKLMDSSVSRSTLLKPSKPSEETVRQVFDTMITSVELGGKLLKEGLFPLIEKIVLDSRRKKSVS